MMIKMGTLFKSRGRDVEKMQNKSETAMRKNPRRELESTNDIPSPWQPNPYGPYAPALMP